MIKTQAKFVFQCKVLTFCLFCSTYAFAQELQTYLFKDIAFHNEEYSVKHEEFLNFIDGSNFVQANNVALKLSAQISENTAIDKMSYAMAMTNSAVSHALIGNLTLSILDLDTALHLGEASGRFNLNLINILMVKAHVSQLNGNFKEAENALRRSQHIFHRHDGVYAEGQLPVIKALAEIHLQNGKLLAADREQLFRLKVNEEVFGSNNEEIIPTLESLGLYFANRASAIPNTGETEIAIYRDKLFREAINLFERSLTIIENKYDANDLRLVGPLRGLSKTRFMQGASFAEARKSMERASEIISNNPTTDISDHAISLVALGDTYLITQDSRSLEVYIQAWNLLGETQKNEALRTSIFSQPKLLFPDVLIRPLLLRQPSNTDPEDDLFVSLEYDVRHDGKVRNINVTDGNVPNNQKKLLRDYVSNMKYRPRLVDGEPTTTEGIKLYQKFRVTAQKSALNRPDNTSLNVEQTIPSDDID
jgi:tetratricopeptide (TPR) repeat protein